MTQPPSAVKQRRPSSMLNQRQEGLQLPVKNKTQDNTQWGLPGRGTWELGPDRPVLQQQDAASSNLLPRRARFCFPVPVSFPGSSWHAIWAMAYWDGASARWRNQSVPAAGCWLGVLVLDRCVVFCLQGAAGSTDAGPSLGLSHSSQPAGSVPASATATTAAQTATPQNNASDISPRRCEYGRANHRADDTAPLVRSFARLRGERCVWSCPE